MGGGVHIPNVMNFSKNKRPLDWEDQNPFNHKGAQSKYGLLCPLVVSCSSESLRLGNYFPNNSSAYFISAFGSKLYFDSLS